MDRRWARLRAVVALAVVATGLTVIGSQSASGAGQNGINNYAGPRSCINNPLDPTNAHATYGVLFDTCGPATGLDPVTAQTSSTGAGLNVYEASGNGGSVTQTNTSGRNLAVCVLAPPTFVGPNTLTKHECSFTQTNQTGNNDITADVQVVHNFTQTGGTGSVSQDAEIALTGTQSSSSGDNTVRGQGSAPAKLRIAETLASNLSASVPADQSQESLMLAQLSQNATTNGDNVIDLDLERDETMSASAASPLQEQDIDDDPAVPNGRALVKQISDSGTNTYRARADDTKSAHAQVLDGGVLGGLRQTQGRPGGGWLTQTEQDSLNNPQGSTVDLGPEQHSPDGTTNIDPSCNFPGVVKKWTLTASGPLGGNSPYNGPAQRRQDDDITIPIIGKSPWTTKSYECTSLNAPAGTAQTAHISADGHNKSGWTGAVAAALNANQPPLLRWIEWTDRQQVNVNLDCDNVPNACTEDAGGVTGSGTNFSATEGVEYSGEVARFVDTSPAQGAYNATINWGDGPATSGGTIVPLGDGKFVVNGTHTYADDGLYTVKISLDDDPDPAEASEFTATADVEAAAVDLTAHDNLVANAQTFSGEVATFADANTLSDPSHFRATIAWGDGQTTDPATITGSGGDFSVSGSHTYAASQPLGPQTITVTLYDAETGEQLDQDQGQITTFKYLASGSFAIGDRSAQNNPGNVTWWSPTWSSQNSLSGGAAPVGFKGFANQLAGNPPKCSDGNWKSSTGTSPPPPSAIASYMAVVVTSKVSGGSKPSGDIVKVVVVKTNAGYQPNAGSPGTGSIVAVVCSD